VKNNTFFVYNYIRRSAVSGRLDLLSFFGWCMLTAVQSYSFGLQLHASGGQLARGRRLAMQAGGAFGTGRSVQYDRQAPAALNS
jgi:hypothetical protein